MTMGELKWFNLTPVERKFGEVPQIAYVTAANLGDAIADLGNWLGLEWREATEAEVEADDAHSARIADLEEEVHAVDVAIALADTEYAAREHLKGGE